MKDLIKLFLRAIPISILWVFLGWATTGCMSIKSAYVTKDTPIRQYTEALPTKHSRAIDCKSIHFDKVQCTVTKRTTCTTQEVQEVQRVKRVLRTPASGLSPSASLACAGSAALVGGLLSIVILGSLSEPKQDAYAVPVLSAGTGIIALPFLLQALINKIRLRTSTHNLGEHKILADPTENECEVTPIPNVALVLYTGDTTRPIGETNAQGQVTFTLRDYLQPVYYSNIFIKIKGTKTRALLPSGCVQKYNNLVEINTNTKKILELIDEDNYIECRQWLEDNQYRPSKYPRIHEVFECALEGHVAKIEHQIGLGTAASRDIADVLDYVEGSHDHIAYKISPTLQARLQNIQRIHKKLKLIELAKQAKTSYENGSFEQADQDIRTCLELDKTNSSCLSTQKKIARSRKHAEQQEKREKTKTVKWAKARKKQAILAAKTAVANNLKSPGTASWVSAAVALTSGRRFFVHVTVDATNGFGAYIRAVYCVIVRLDEKNPKRYYTDHAYAVQTCPRQMDVDTLTTFLILNEFIPD